MFVVPLIERKRDGGALTPEEWSALVAAYTAGRVPDYQMSALLMAGYFPVLTGPVSSVLGGLAPASGQRPPLLRRGPPAILKHSTGRGGAHVLPSAGPPT